MEVVNEKLINELKRFDDDIVVVLSVKADDGEVITYEIADISEAWLESGVIAIEAGKIITE